jgi:hypothetical protein
MDRSVAQISDELYALPPQAFTAARDTYVAQARIDGDTAAAKQLAALKRPSIVGYLVNLLALQRADALERLLSLAGRRAADGAAVRELSAQRRHEMQSLLTLSVELAGQAGVPAPTRNQLAEVESTLSAALVDEQAAALVRSGRVLKALSYGGFGSWEPPTGAEASTATASTGTASTEAAPSGVIQAAPPPAVDPQQAQNRLDAAEQAVADARTLEQAANGRVEQLAAEIERLKEQLDSANRDARTARQARLNAERELASAQRRFARANR